MSVKTPSLRRWMANNYNSVETITQFKMSKKHTYKSTVKWTGNKGHGTFDSRLYGRDHEIQLEGKATILGSSDPTFRGDKSKHNPEELLLASLSSCHMLWYLKLCTDVEIIVVDYIDAATATMVETDNGGGHFSKATLHPVVTITDGSRIDEANELHKKAHELCFIANSVNFPVLHQPTCIANEGA